MKGVSTLENLQVPWNEINGPHGCRPAVEDIGDGIETFIGRGSQIRRIFEYAAVIPILDGKRDSEIVGVEVPRKPVSLFDNIDNDIRKRISVAKETVSAERALDERLERVILIDRAKARFGAKIDRRNKGV